MTTVAAPPAAAESLSPRRKARRPFGPGSIVKYGLAILFLLIVPYLIHVYRAEKTR